MSEDFSYYSEIKKVDFYILGSEENLIDSAVNVTNKELFKGEIPVLNGCYDANMGTTSYSYICGTCDLSKSGGSSLGILNSKRNSPDFHSDSCPGHPGSIDLSYPVKSPLFRSSILRWLKIICFKCGRLLINKDIHVASSRLLIEYVKLAKSIDECPHCGEPHPSVFNDKFEQSKFLIEYGSGPRPKREELFNHQIREILNKISNETVLKMQKPIKSHPKNFILDIIRVAPNTIRPDIRRQGGVRSNNNDITALTKKIVEINEFLPMEIPPVEEISKELREMYHNLDLAYYELVKGTPTTNNQVRMVTTTSSNKPANSIASRIPKKPGRVRKNLMGKRTTMMLRSVFM
jgi:DNA-directed RNA polymerase II subunit RPB1